MKKLFVGMALGALALTLGLISFWQQRPKPKPVATFDRTPRGALVRVLCGERERVEVLVRPRHAAGPVATFTDAALSRELGVAEAEYAFLEVIVANFGTEAVPVDPAGLELRDANGTTHRGSSLRGLSRGAGAIGPLIAAHGGPADPMLSPRRARTLVIAVPARVAFPTLVSGAFAGVELAPRSTTLEKLEAWRETPRPPETLLQAILEIPKREPAPDDEGGGR